MTIQRRIQTIVAPPGELPFESNILVREMETRPDWRVPGASEYVYVLRDLWPQMNGSAESWPQWARDDYLKPQGDPCGNDSAGGETHLFAVTTGTAEQCGVSHGKLYIAWTDGFSKLGDPSYAGYDQETATRTHGWVNWFDSNGYFPDREQRGPWCWCPVGPADVVDGGGLPYNRHVSWFAVWEKMTYAEYLDEKNVPVVVPTSLEFAQAVALTLATLVTQMDTIESGGVVYHYMLPDEIVARSIAIEQQLSAAYAE